MNDFFKINRTPFIKKYAFIIVGVIISHIVVMFLLNTLPDGGLRINEGTIPVIDIYYALCVPIITLISCAIFNKKIPTNKTDKKIIRDDIFVILVAILSLVVLLTTHNSFSGFGSITILINSPQLFFENIILLIDYVAINEKKNYRNSLTTILINASCTVIHLVIFLSFFL